MTRIWTRPHPATDHEPLPIVTTCAEGEATVCGICKFPLRIAYDQPEGQEFVPAGTTKWLAGLLRPMADAMGVSGAGS